jgi:hypothetical protein
MEEKKIKGFKLGEILVQKGYITWEQLEEVLNLQAQTGEAKEVTAYHSKPVGRTLNLGEILIRNGWITWNQLSDALERQKKTGERLGDILIDMKALSKKDLYRGLAVQADLSFVDFEKITVQPDVLNLISRREALEQHIMPLVKQGHILLVAMSDPNAKLEGIQISNYEVRGVLAVPEEIAKAHQKYYPV